MITPNLLKNQNILLRADLDIPIKDGVVENSFRLECLLPTLRLCLESGRSVLIIGHLGRPLSFNPKFSLNPARKWLESALHQAIYFIDSGFSPGEWNRGTSRLAMLENLRFSPAELSEDPAFSSGLCEGSDLYIYEAFASFNPSASLHKIPEVLPTYTGLQFDLEVAALEKVRKNTDRPSLLVISGVKEDKKIIVDNLVDNFDNILIGGRLSLSFPSNGTKIIPGVLTSDTLDIDDSSTQVFLEYIRNAKLIVLNGPLGKFEDLVHSKATKAILEAIKLSPAFSVLGGGDTISAIRGLSFNYSDFGFVSTGGGAMLEYLATGTHPLLEVLKKLPQALQ